MAMAMAGGTRAVVGRATTSFTAMAAISSSSSNIARLPPPPPPPSYASSSASYSAAIRAGRFPSRLRLMQCRRLQRCSWDSAAPPRSLGTRVAPSFSSSSSSSVTSVDTVGQEQPSSSSSGPTSGGESSPAVDVDAIDIRVGRVLRAWKHPEADSLYVEEVDLAEPEGPRTICSGLVSYMPLEELQGRAVLVFANLKARNMRGVKSNGMLLAASNAEHTIVQLLSPPEGAALGERVWFGEASDQEGQSPAGSPNQVQKKKIWESIQPLLKTTEDCVATLQSKPMRTSVGVVTCQSLQGANIS